MNQAQAITTARELMGSNVVVSLVQDDTTTRGDLFGVRSQDNRVLVMKHYPSVNHFDAEIEGIRIARDYAGIPSPLVVLSSRSHLVVFFERLEGLNWAQLLTREHIEIQREVAQRIGKVVNSVHSVARLESCQLRSVSLDSLLINEANDLEQTISTVKSVALDSSAENSEVANILVRLQRISSILIRKIVPCTQVDKCGLTTRVVLHGDLWSGNLFVSLTVPQPEVILLDYEYGMIGERVIDLARIYSRGFVPRDFSKEYKLEPDPDLWRSFGIGYGHALEGIWESAHFHRGLLFSLLRTINYYRMLIREHERESNRLLRYIQTIRRMSNATVDWVNANCL